MKNATMWKRILNEGFGVWPNARLEEEKYDQIINKIISAPVLVSGTTQSHNGTWFDLRGVAMPFPKFWIEGVIVGAPSPSYITWGCLFESSKPDDSGFSIVATGFSMLPGGRPEMTAEMKFDLDAQGTPDYGGKFIVEMTDDIVNFANGDRELARAAMCYPAQVGCLALMVLGCKNVSLQSHELEEVQAKRAAKRTGKTQDYFRYHTLVVRPPGVRGQNHPGTEIDVMPHHVCRAHFSEYGPEFGKGLLFGKYAGRFFVPSCVKGDKKRGTVEKDYEVLAEK